MESGDSHRFQTFDLNNTPPFADVHHRQGTATSISPCNCRVRSFIKCTTGCSIKRRSPSPSSTLEEPPTKRAALCPPSAATANGYVAAAVSDGIKNDADAALATPEKTSPSGTNLQNVLNRSLSETITYHTRAKEALNSQPVESSKINISVSSPEADTWPPLPPVLYGSSSEPIPSDYLPEADATTPSKTLLFPSPPGSDPDSAGADSRRLRRMKERMKQMNQWIQKLTDDDEEDTINQNTIDTNPKKMSQETKLTPEAVVVEENGENLILHFNCPCGKGFEIFLSGRKCYYRLL